MRVGNNPLKINVAPDRLQDVVLTCITHLPNQIGYHAERFEVVRTCLTSMRMGARRAHTLMVWDNGSCPELRDWLQNVFKPDVLILSGNVGKNTARTSLFGMVKADSIVTFSDDDMYFYDNWLNPQIELLQNFPNVASVSGYPVRTSFRWGNENTLNWAKMNGTLECQRFMPEQWERDFCLSIGRDYEAHRQTTATENDYRVTYQGRQAYCTSHHCQFIGNAGTLNKVKVYDTLALGSERNYDIALDKLGLRLSTTKRLTRHIGNVIHDELRKEITTC